VASPPAPKASYDGYDGSMDNRRHVRARDGDIPTKRHIRHLPSSPCVFALKDGHDAQPVKAATGCQVVFVEIAID
jgi:hypothetical protein